MPIPRLYTCNWTLFPAMDVVEAARFTAREGFAGIELEATPLGFWPTTVAAATIDELGRIGKNEGIAYSVHAPDSLNPATDQPEMRHRDEEIVRRLVDIAVRLSSPVVGIHPGVAHTLFALERQAIPYSVPRYSRDRLMAEARGRAMATYVEWGVRCREAGLILTVENEGHVRHTVAPRPEILADLIRRASQPNVKANFDTGHAYIGAGLFEEFTILQDLIVHLHLNDGRSPGLSEHLPLGAGRADFSPLASFIARMEGAAVLEIYAPDRPLEAIRASRDFLLDILRKAGVSV
jgi:sugar phosphate isomerase/epimerase